MQTFNKLLYARAQVKAGQIISNNKKKHKCVVVAAEMIHCLVS